MDSFEPSTFDSYLTPNDVRATAIKEPAGHFFLRMVVEGLAVALGLAALIVGLSLMLGDPRRVMWGTLTIGGGLVLSFVAYAFGMFLVERFFKVDGQAQAGGDNRVGPAPIEDDRTANQRALAQYHELTKKQAASSYRISQFAMAVGFAMLVGGGYVVIRQADTTSSQIIVGGLAAFGAAFSSYIGATFVRTYNKALAQMNFYYAQPLVQSYILQAEKLSERFRDRNTRDSALLEIIDQTLRGADVAAQLTRPASDTAGTGRRLHVRREGPVSPAMASGASGSPTDAAVPVVRTNGKPV